MEANCETAGSFVRHTRRNLAALMATGSIILSACGDEQRGDGSRDFPVGDSSALIDPLRPDLDAKNTVCPGVLLSIEGQKNVESLTGAESLPPLEQIARHENVTLMCTANTDPGVLPDINHLKGMFAAAQAFTAHEFNKERQLTIPSSNEGQQEMTIHFTVERSKSESILVLTQDEILNGKYDTDNPKSDPSSVLRVIKAPSSAQGVDTFVRKIADSLLGDFGNYDIEEGTDSQINTARFSIVTAVIWATDGKSYNEYEKFVIENNLNQGEKSITLAIVGKREYQTMLNAALQYQTQSPGLNNS